MTYKKVMGRAKYGKYHKYYQRGRTAYAKDRHRTAKPVGWRKSKSGKWYFENRRNRSDVSQLLHI